MAAHDLLFGPRQWQRQYQAADYIADDRRLLAGHYSGETTSVGRLIVPGPRFVSTAGSAREQHYWLGIGMWSQLEATKARAEQDPAADNRRVFFSLRREYYLMHDQLVLSRGLPISWNLRLDPLVKETRDQLDHRSPEWELIDEQTPFYVGPMLLELNQRLHRPGKAS